MNNINTPPKAMIEEFFNSALDDLASIKSLKKIVVDLQKYEMAATLRDFEVKKERSIIAKWTPIINLGGFDHLTQDQKNKICIYCEKHAKFESKHNITSESNDSMLPLSLKILSKINLEGKNIEISYTQIETTSNHFILDAGILDLNNISIVDLFESTIISESVNVINDKLVNNDTIILDIVMTSISSMLEGSFSPRILMTHRINFTNKTQFNGLIVEGNPYLSSKWVNENISKPKI